MELRSRCTAVVLSLLTLSPLGNAQAQLSPSEQVPMLPSASRGPLPAPLRSPPPVVVDDDERQAAEMAKFDNQISLVNKRIELESANARLRALGGQGRAPSGVPQLVGISGRSDRLIAKLLYEQSTLSARTGQLLPSGYVLRAIQRDRALLRTPSGEEVVIPLTLAQSRGGVPPSPTSTFQGPPVDSAGPIVSRSPGSR